MVESCPKDVRVSYKNTSITLNSVLLISFSKMFQNLITCEFKDSAVRNFEYSDEFPGVSEDVFGLFFGLIHYENSVEFSISNILEFFQLSVYFQVDQLKLACQDFLVSNSFSQEELFHLLKTCNDKNQFYFIDQNTQIFLIFSNIDSPSYPLRVSFITSLLPVVDPFWLFKCLIELYKNEYSLDPKTNELLKFPEEFRDEFIKIFELIDSIGDDHLISTLLEWSIDVFENVKSFTNVPPDWFLWTLQNNSNYFTDLNLFGHCFLSIVTLESLENYPNLCLPKNYLELLCSILPGDFGVWLGKCLVKSWKNSEQFNFSWTNDSFSKCVSLIMDKTDLNVVRFLNSLMEINNDSKLGPAITTFIAKTSLDLLSSREKAGNQLYSDGLQFVYGNCVPQNYEKAFTLFNEGANHNHVDCIFKLGGCYYSGFGVEKNLFKAFECFKTSAELKNVFGVVNVGWCFFSGKGVDKNKSEALQWFKKAAELGNPQGFYGLHRCYFEGLGVEKNVQEGLGYLEVAVSEGDPEAMNTMAGLLRTGTALEQNLNDAIKYFKLAADGGCSYAIRNLGEKYRSGLMVPRNRQKALELFIQSANLNNTSGIDSLITFYEECAVLDPDLLSYWEKKKVELKGCDPTDILKRRGLL
ncbi:hypothetical protein GEMRC1_009770 [Eukaryota sp. GEM-RC1]